jgi:hypothetical protein
LGRRSAPAIRSRSHLNLQRTSSSSRTSCSIADRQRCRSGADKGKGQQLCCPGALGTGFRLSCSNKRQRTRSTGQKHRGGEGLWKDHTPTGYRRTCKKRGPYCHPIDNDGTLTIKASDLTDQVSDGHLSLRPGVERLIKAAYYKKISVETSDPVSIAEPIRGPEIEVNSRVPLSVTELQASKVTVLALTIPG